MTKEKTPPPRVPSDEYRDEFIKLFLSIIDISSGMRQAKIDLTHSLLNQGAMMNPQEMFAMTDLILDRMQRAQIVKTLAPMLGLTSEQSDIMRRELDLLYSSRPTQPQKLAVISGENQNGQ